VRTVLGLIAGIVVALIAILLVSQIGAMLFPVGGLDADARDPERFSAAFTEAPIGSKLSLILALLAAAWAGGAAARLVSRRGWTAWGIAGLVLLLALAVVFVIGLPTWLQLALIVAPLVGGMLGHHVPAARARPVREETADAQI
jgi:hypothetical protein